VQIVLISEILFIGAVIDNPAAMTVYPFRMAAENIGIGYKNEV